MHNQENNTTKAAKIEIIVHHKGVKGKLSADAIENFMQRTIDNFGTEEDDFWFAKDKIMELFPDSDNARLLKTMIKSLDAYQAIFREMKLEGEKHG